MAEAPTVVEGDAAHLYQEINLGINADVAEWCPTPGYQHILAAGTYKLNEETKTREGRLFVFSLTGWPLDDDQVLIQQASTLDMPGIFDLRWSKKSRNTRPLLAAALADGTIRLLQPPSPDNTSTLEIIASSESHADSMAVSVEFIQESDQQEDQKLIASYSCGSLNLLQTLPTGELQSLIRWHAHDLEAWAAAGDCWNPSIVYSGGDDCAFKCWDIRTDCSSPVWINRRSHTAGVCCIASNPHQEHVLATGSYDEGVRIWDTRMVSDARPAVLAVDAKTQGGGVWRLKWHPTSARLLLGACMHAGFMIFNVNGFDSIDLVELYPHQQTLAYGAGWHSLAGGAENKKSLVATCSFYDQLLHVWSPKTRLL